MAVSSPLLVGCKLLEWKTIPLLFLHFLHFTLSPRRRWWYPVFASLSIIQSVREQGFVSSASKFFIRTTRIHLLVAHFGDLFSEWFQETCSTNGVRKDDNRIWTELRVIAIHQTSGQTFSDKRICQQQTFRSDSRVVPFYIWINCSDFLFTIAIRSSSENNL